MGLSLVHEHNRALSARWRVAALFRYVYRPWERQLESPKPYLQPVRTLGGALVSLYRPHGHVWHKGISWSLANVGPENFWGGPTYLRDQGYRQLANNGTQRHLAFPRLDATPERIDVTERRATAACSGAGRVRSPAASWCPRMAPAVMN